MRVLLTGGAGFIGSHVAEACLETGMEVCVIDNLSSGREENIPKNVVFHQTDIRDRNAVAKVFADFKPDAVCHQAAQTSVSVSMREAILDAESNIIGTIHLIEESLKHQVKQMVFASTGGAIYGEVATLADTNTLPKPISPYACSKLSAEHYLLGYGKSLGLKGTVLRYANVYGPRQDPHGEAGVVAIFSKKLFAGESVQINAKSKEGDEGCIRDYVFVQDVARANLKALKGELLGQDIYNIGTGVPTATQALAEILYASLGNKKGPLHLVHAGKRPGDLERSVLKPSLPFEVHMQEGLAKTMAWFEVKS